DGAFQVFRLMNARIGGFLPGIQYGENSFSTDHAQLQRIKLVDQLTHRAENHIDIHDEGNHHTERYRAIESPLTSEPNQQTQCDRHNNFNNRKEYGKIPVRPDMCISVLGIDARKFVILLLFPGEILNNADSGNMLLKKGI